jgi:Exo-beta-D-glucosaminidase Ig-fold domain/Concanavalin A-like lectin/glucanases superfamily/Glycosyl hydrolases family 2/Glycosyl hydrolases family 2, sugar binding domain/Glycosyl hydrolases family 2, TIM barrel domain
LKALSAAHTVAFSNSIALPAIFVRIRTRSEKVMRSKYIWGVLCLALCATALAQTPARDANHGPYNATFLAGGVGITRSLKADDSTLNASAAWTLSGWLKPAFLQPGEITLAGVGDASHCRCLVLEDGKLTLMLDADKRLRSNVTMITNEWQAIAATYDGKIAHLYLNGRDVGSLTAATTSVAATIVVAPVSAESPLNAHFGGSWADLTLSDRAWSADDVKRWTDAKPAFDLMVFEQVGAGWPWQEHAWRGLLVPQDPWTLPHSSVAASKPSAKTPSPVELQPIRDNTWALHAWRLIEEPRLNASAAEISQTAFDDHDWYSATVPGTVLTTLIDRGVYPDPYYGLNNLAIPENLARQRYWYRTTFSAPAQCASGDCLLTFKGINYAAEVWLNGKRIGDIKGAFQRGIFDVSSSIKAGMRNALAVRISPPPHPGIPHEESILAGPGENGGNLAIDGPTFIASEGWDWIPGIRDRNSGLWQDVELSATGRLRIGDAHVITLLPLPKTDSADVTIAVPITNSGKEAVSATIDASFDNVTVERTLNIPPGRSEVNFAPADFPQLHVAHPRLWWPNGYGEANLYTLTITAKDRGQLSDTHSLRFGMRELTYELSLFESSGRLRRVEVNPTLGAQRGERLIDVRHEAIKKTPNGWAESLTRAGEASPAVRDIDTASLTPYLAIRVNGIPIAVRGGSWGTDDALKRVSRERLEPYFKLHRAANLNIIRNWLGQNTEDVFYDLADEYGLLILNDFWASTQDFQVEPQDPQLFLANARDVISRYRNHPSIAVWFGRNEGVPQPIINEGLDDLVAELDGTRYFTGSSNNINLQGSGPYNYRPAVQYFTQLAQGFSVEVGTPSLSTIDSLKATIPAQERWPISDTLAYHDWHFGGNGDVASFMQTIDARFGAATSLEDFERKAQMLNYETYRAIFEGFQAHLWTRNSGRLLWMTHPSWPSNAWQIYSSDYDTHAAYYGVKQAVEPLHAQLNLPDYALTVINTTREPRKDLRLTSRVVTLDNRVLLNRAQRVQATANAAIPLAALPLQPILDREELVLLVLTLQDAKGATLSHNVYWLGRNEASYQRMNQLSPATLTISSRREHATDAEIEHITLTNTGPTTAIATKLTMLGTDDQRVLPAYYSDNYITMLPGEKRTVDVSCPVKGTVCEKVALRGWNVPTGTFALSP